MLTMRRCSMVAGSQRQMPLHLAHQPVGHRLPRLVVRADPQTHVSEAASASQVLRDMDWFRVPYKVYFKGGALEEALSDLKGRARAFIVTDKGMFDIKYVDKVTSNLYKYKIAHQVFFHVEPEPTIESIEAGLHELIEFRPDVIIGLGGGSPMDAAKLMWLMYELPGYTLNEIVTTSADMRTSSIAGPTLGRKATMVTIPTTSGTGSEVTPFAVVTDSEGNKMTVASHNLTPRMAIVDPQLSVNLPPSLTAKGGIHALSHGIESFTSRYSSVFTEGLSKESVNLVFKYLERAYLHGNQDNVAMEKMHNAACISGLAFANTMLGLAHSMASAVAGHYRVAHNLAIAPLMPLVIIFNAEGSEEAAARYAELAALLHLPAHPKGPAHALAHAVKELSHKVDLPGSLKEVVGASNEEHFKAARAALAAKTLSDLHSGANARSASSADVQRLLTEAW